MRTTAYVLQVNRNDGFGWQPFMTFNDDQSEHVKRSVTALRKQNAPYRYRVLAETHNVKELNW